MAVVALIHGFVREIEWTQLWLQGCGRWEKNRHTMTHRLDVDNRWPPPRDYQASGCGRNRRADGPVFDHAVGLVCLVLICNICQNRANFDSTDIISMLSYG